MQSVLAWALRLVLELWAVCNGGHLFALAASLKVSDVQRHVAPDTGLGAVVPYKQVQTPRRIVAGGQRLDDVHW